MSDAALPLCLDDLAPIRGGNISADSRGPHTIWWFQTVADALVCARELGGHAEIPADMLARIGYLRPSNKKGVLVLEFERQPNDVFRGAHPSTKKWIVPLGVLADQRKAAERIKPYDDIVRKLVADDEGGKTASDQGWCIRQDTGKWTSGYPRGEVRSFLAARCQDDPDLIMGWALACPWRIVNLPFQPVEPGERQWNHGAAQLRCQPVAGAHPTWDMILNHIGQDLDGPLSVHEWGLRHSVLSGGHYLRVLLANLIRHVERRWPYVFLFGEQNSGKSLFHEALDKLIDGGIAQVDRALTNQSDFCGELENAIVGVIEEKDISHTKGAYAKLKQWVTGLTISIRKMRHDSFDIPNVLRFIQCANSRDACPAFAGDTRILFLHVAKPDKEIPKPVLLARLTDEAPAFTNTLLTMPLPEPEGRLCVPVIETAHKTQAMENNADEFVAALVEAVDDTLEFTAKGKDDGLQAKIGPGPWPGNMRAIKAALDRERSYLAHHGIAFSFRTRANKTEACILTRR